MPEVILAAHVPVFDRLMGITGGRVDPSLLDGAGLRDSLLTELAAIFNSRSHLTIEAYLTLELTVLDYGLPDFSALSVQSEVDRDVLRQVLLTAIRFFEPRLKQVHAVVTTDPQHHEKVSVQLQSAVSLGKQMRRVHFELGMAPMKDRWVLN